MNLISKFVRIEANHNEGVVFLDADSSVASGYAAAVRFYPSWSHVVILKSKYDPKVFALAALPSEKWEDSIGDEWEMVQRLQETSATPVEATKP